MWSCFSSSSTLFLSEFIYLYQLYIYVFMFNSVKNRPNGGGSGSGDGGGTGRNNDRSVTHDKKSKRVSLFRFRMAKRHPERSNSRPSPSVPRVVGGGLGFCLCFRPTPTLDSPGELSQTSDPNSSGFNFELLKGLIESNDFYSSECNTHLDDENS